MSVYYTVKEHLIVKNMTKASIPVEVMKRQLSLLGALMLTDDAYVTTLELTVDGAEHRFSGKEISSDLHTLLRAMDQGKNMELVANYEYRWRSSMDYLSVGPFAVCDCVKDCLQEDPKQAENLFYSMYNEADCESGAGILTAYGKKDGKTYNGQIELTSAALPEDGVWKNQDTTIVFEADLTDDMDYASIEQICHAFEERFPDVSFEQNEHSVYFCVNNLTLRSKAEFEGLIDLYAKLICATDGECGMIGEFVDLSGKDAGILELDIEADGSFTLKSAVI